MNKSFIALIIFFLSLSFLFPQDIKQATQEKDLISIPKDDLDSLFDEPFEQTQVPEATPKEPVKNPTVISDIRKRGIEFNASYFFRGAINPGWDMYPWDFDGNEQFSWALGIEMGSKLRITSQISESFRVISVFTYQIPGFNLTLGDFFFDYNFYNKVFLRAGKYEHSWGVSPNFSFTNLLSRIMITIDPNFPKENANGDSYIAKFDIPIGIGGLQLLTLTRYNIAGGDSPPRQYFGYGGKFNLAFSWADFNLGLYYQEFMATRSFLSAKTVLFNFDVYNEWLFTYNNHTDDSVNISFNIGLSRPFFKNKLELNAEYYFNGEETTFYYRPQSEFRQQDTSPFLQGNNIAFNLLYRLDGNLNPRVFAKILYGDESYSLVTGLRITPFSNTEIYFAIPMVLGSKDGHYYKDSFNVLNQHRPFSFVLYVSFTGSVSASHYY